MIEHQKIIERKKSQKEEFIEAFMETPIVLFVCHKVGISRATFYRWRNEDEHFDNQFKEAERIGRENFNDIAESSLVSLVKEKDYKAISYYLKHNHPRYSESINSLKENDAKNISLGIEKMGNSLDEDKSFFGSLFTKKVPGKIIRILQRFYPQIIKRREKEEDIKKLNIYYKLKGIEDGI